VHNYSYVSPYGQLNMYTLASLPSIESIWVVCHTLLFVIYMTNFSLFRES